MPDSASDNGSAPAERPIIVLLVDDQAFVGVAVGRLLASAPDIALHHCQLPMRAIALANDLAPAVIFVDLLMPELDGLTLLGQLRANPQTAATPVIVLSGNDDATTRARALAQGAAGFMVKLPPKAELLACIRQYGARGAAREDTLDRVAIDRLHESGDNPDFTRHLIDLFIDEARSCVETMTDASARGDAGTLDATAHRLKGTSLIMGAVRLAALCAQVERQTAAPASGLRIASMTEIADEMACVQLALAARRAEVGRG